jgi:sulfite reductase alpha subunit-like flavoprotein
LIDEAELMEINHVELGKLEEFKEEDLSHADELKIFIMATHGEGEPTSNA